MLRYIYGAFIALHGLVHLLYFGQSQRLFELQTGMMWPDGAWISKPLTEGATRTLAGVCCVLVAVAFAVGGIGVLAGGAWWRPVVLFSAGFSSTIYALFWDGKTEALADQGAVGVLINVAILLGVLLFQWPAFDF